MSSPHATAVASDFRSGATVAPGSFAGSSDVVHAVPGSANPRAAQSLVMVCCMTVGTATCGSGRALAVTADDSRDPRASPRAVVLERIGLDERRQLRLRGRARAVR